MIKLFGITGFKASGKTTVSSFIRKRGVPVISIDDVCIDLLKPGTNVYKELILLLGEDVIQIDGNLDIKQLSLLSYNENWIKNLVDDLIKSECINFINILLETLDKPPLPPLKPKPSLNGGRRRSKKSDTKKYKTKSKSKSRSRISTKRKNKNHNYRKSRK